jgi:peroxiredoxin/tetratricopeptide (TPR) repeat protein
MSWFRPLFIALVIASLAAAQGGGTRAAARNADSAPPASAEAIKQGHSHYGAAFDTGPRSRPFLMKDIASAPFPITHKNPEVQVWFNQGNTLLHHFWDFEAERAFRWALKLEPDNAMLYWGLARAAGGERSKDFIREAARRKNTVSERERLYIEALEAQTLTDTLRDRGDSWEDRHREAVKVIETICVRYPDDLEARAWLALLGMGQSRYGTERIIREILGKNPDHPGAHHYRIHNWNYHEPEQALESCKRYGALAPGSGHALHMPGHVYATVGMWHEAAISMDAATRTEKKNMRERMTFPFNHWNYGHNRAYLSYIQEQLGMADAAIFGARQLIDAPLDPKANADNAYSSHSQGITSLLRALVKFERWEEIVRPGTFPWRDIFMDKMNRAYAETRARIGLRQLDKADKSLDQHAALKQDLEKNKNWTEVYEIQSLELRGRLQFAKGNTLEGLSLLSQAAEKQFEQQKNDNDPPKYPELLYNALGRACLDTGSPGLAVKAFAKSLTLARNDIFALSGLVVAHHAAGETKEAEAAMARLLYMASGADKGLPVVERARATGVVATPRDSSPGPQRSYPRTSLDRFGPAVWEPFAAPSLKGTDSEGKLATLDEYKGRNILLVFYLGRECLHCMNQLKAISEKHESWSQADTAVLAVSPNKPEETREALRTAKLQHIRFVSDPDRANAHRFSAYDDFEDMEIHATILIDKVGRIHWGSIGGEPFTDMNFLEKQLKRMNDSVRN